ncbi:hypothetical protein N1851_031454 [Merluccius polli]|uniref:Ig-like domain-containing protein n=1 Tax=Merluccius polli TaxID=89951 RepID=A0AA47M3U1_MERPO|nr:hypothetical protein N1851_031454 [Merluccius polli]
MALVLIRHLLLSSFTWLVVSLPDSKTVEVEPRGDVTLSCTNVSSYPTVALWMTGDNTSKPIIISSVFGTDNNNLEYMDGFQQGRHVLKSNLFFINLTILQVEVSDSGWYCCLFYHNTKLVMVNSTFLKINAWLIVSLPDSKTLEVEPRGDVTLSCTNVSSYPTVALWMTGDNTSKPIIISSVFGTDNNNLEYMDGFQQGRHVLKSNLFFINLTILQVEVSDSGWYCCLFYHNTKLVMVNSTFLKINGRWISSFIKRIKMNLQIHNSFPFSSVLFKFKGDDTLHKEDDTNSKSDEKLIMVGGILGAMIVLVVLVIFAWLLVSLPDSLTLEVEPRDNVTLSCTNVSSSPTVAFWMRGDNTSKPIMISSVFGTERNSVRYMDGFQQGRHVLDYKLIFLKLAILQVEMSDSGWYFCLFYLETELVIVNSTFLKVHGRWISSFINRIKMNLQIRNSFPFSSVLFKFKGDDTLHKEDDTNSKSDEKLIMVGGILGAVIVLVVLVIFGHYTNNKQKSTPER